MRGGGVDRTKGPGKPRSHFGPFSVRFVFEMDRFGAGVLRGGFLGVNVLHYRTSARPGGLARHGFVKLYQMKHIAKPGSAKAYQMKHLTKLGVAKL